MKYLVLFLVLTCIPRLALGHSPDLTEKLKKAVMEELPKNTKIQVEDVQSRVNIPSTAQVNLLSPHPGVGNVSFEARWKERGFPRKVFGSAHVRAFAPVWVARTIVRHGDALDSTNTSFEVRELSPYLTTGYFIQGEITPALRAHGTLRAGVVLGANNSQPALLIQPGQAVDLVHQAGGLRIVAKVKALEGGNTNHWVRVENPSSKKIFLARVTAPGEVKLR